jgi:hypothetical protein
MSPPQQQQVGKIAPRSLLEARVSVSSHPHSGFGHLKISPACQPMSHPPGSEGSRRDSERRYRARQAVDVMHIWMIRSPA